MFALFNTASFGRTLMGTLAALVLGGTFVLAAAGPAVAAQVTIAAESNIVRGE